MADVRLTALASTLAVGLAAGGLLSSPEASTGATRVVDRALVCKTGFANGVRSITVTARSAFGKGGKLEWLAAASVATPGALIPSKKNAYLPTLTGVTAGWPPPPPLTSGGMGFNTKLCGGTRSKVPLSSRGLGGGAASQLGEELKCVTPQKVLVRIRSTFAEPTTPELDRKARWYGADSRIEKGQLAVRTLAGKPLVYGEVFDSGKARLFTARGCF
jgi:hypothetical protein